MQISKGRFKELIREEVEKHLHEQRQEQWQTETNRMMMAQLEAKIRLSWVKNFINKITSSDSKVSEAATSEKEYRKLLKGLQRLTKFEATVTKAAEEKYTPKLPKRFSRYGSYGGTGGFERKKGTKSRYGTYWGSAASPPGGEKKKTPGDPNAIAALHSTIGAGQQHGRRVFKKGSEEEKKQAKALHAAKVAGNFIPGPSALVCEQMNPNIAGTVAYDMKGDLLELDFFLNSIAAFDEACLDPYRVLTKERPLSCGDFDDEHAAFLIGSDTRTSLQWRGAMSLCNWPIPASGMNITDPIERKIPKLFLSGDLSDFIPSEKTNKLKDIAYKLKHDKPMSKAEQAFVAADLMLMRTPAAPVAMAAALWYGLHKWATEKHDPAGEGIEDKEWAARMAAATAAKTEKEKELALKTAIRTRLPGDMRNAVLVDLTRVVDPSQEYRDAAAKVKRVSKRCPSPSKPEKDWTPKEHKDYKECMKKREKEVGSIIPDFFKKTPTERTAELEGRTMAGCHHSIIIDRPLSAMLYKQMDNEYYAETGQHIDFLPKPSGGTYKWYDGDCLKKLCDNWRGDLKACKKLENAWKTGRKINFRDVGKRYTAPWTK